MELTFLHWAVIFLVVSAIITYLIKKFTKHETFYLVSLIRTKKVLPLFDRYAKIGKVLDYFAEIGLMLGFGVIAVDYLYGKKLKKVNRLGLFAASFVVLVLLFNGFDLLLNKMISTNPLSQHLFNIYAAVFGLFGFGGFTIVSLISQAIDIIGKFFVGKQPCPGVAPLIPGVQIPNVPFTVPLHAWISLLLILIIHEGMHGVVARREKIKVKSAGVLLFGFLPIGAFVEPDDKELKEAEPKKALRLYAAGATANIFSLIFIQLIALGFALFFGFVVKPALGVAPAIVQGVMIEGVQKEIEFCGETYPTPAFGVLEEGMLIKAINDQDISNLSQLQSILAENRFKEVTFTVEKDGKITEHLLAPNKLGSFGITVKELQDPNVQLPQKWVIYRQVAGFLDSFLGWFFILSLLVGIVNFLPLAIFDGGRIAAIIFPSYCGFLRMPKEDTEKFVMRIFFVFLLVLIIINAFPLFL